MECEVNFGSKRTLGFPVYPCELLSVHDGNTSDIFIVWLQEPKQIKLPISFKN